MIPLDPGYGRLRAPETGPVGRLWAAPVWPLAAVFGGFCTVGLVHALAILAA